MDPMGLDPRNQRVKEPVLRRGATKVVLKIARLLRCQRGFLGHLLVFFKLPP